MARESGTSRRMLVRGMAGAALGGLVLPSFARSRAAAGDAPSWLLVQMAQAGTLTPQPGGADRVTLHLQGVGPFVTAFTDRPQHQSAVAPTAPALALFLSDDEPPNAALITTAGGEVLTVILELFSASYDAATEVALYEARMLSETGHPRFQMLDRHRRDIGSLTFGHASLVIDSSKGLPV